MSSTTLQQQAKSEADHFSPDDLRLLKDTICKGADDAEFRLFVRTAKHMRLDPFARQICAVKRWDSSLGRMIMTPQVTIDGFRLTAERTGKYQGQTVPQWCGSDGMWREAWLSDESPAAARIGVYRSGFREPLYAVARYKSYVQTTKDGRTTSMWKKMDDLMLSKCAEALALRKAFPNELSGVYTEDEMAQANHDERQAPVENAPIYECADAVPALPPGKLVIEASASDLVLMDIDCAESKEELQEIKKRIDTFANGDRTKCMQAYFARMRSLPSAGTNKSAGAVMDKVATSLKADDGEEEQLPWDKHLPMQNEETVS